MVKLYFTILISFILLFLIHMQRQMIGISNYMILFILPKMVMALL